MTLENFPDVVTYTRLQKIVIKKRKHYTISVNVHMKLKWQQETYFKWS